MHVSCPFVFAADDALAPPRLAFLFALRQYRALIKAQSVHIVSTVNNRVIVMHCLNLVVML